MYLHVITLYLKCNSSSFYPFFLGHKLPRRNTKGVFLQNTLNLFSLAHVWQGGNKKPPFSIIDLRTSYCNRSG